MKVGLHFMEFHFSALLGSFSVLEAHFLRSVYREQGCFDLTLVRTMLSPSIGVFHFLFRNSLTAASYMVRVGPFKLSRSDKEALIRCRQIPYMLELEVPPPALG